MSPFFKWCHQESNRGHKDFQSFALPTELWHLLDFACKGSAYFGIYKGKNEKNAKFQCILSMENRKTGLPMLADLSV